MDARAADIVRILMLAGCRRGEIQNLRWRKVNSDTLNLMDAKAGLPEPERDSE